MSNRLLDLAWSVPLPPPSKLVLVALADRANDAGKAWPFATELVQRTGLASATLTRHLSALVAAGLITRQPRRHTSTLYVVHERALTKAASAGSEAPERPQSEGTQSDCSRNKNNHSVHQEPSERSMPKENPHEPSIDLDQPTESPQPPPDHFAEFWSAYPKRGGKPMAKDDARRAWTTILKTIHKPDADGVIWTVDQIIAGARRYARECEGMTDRQFVKTPGPWLRKGLWKYEDDTPAAVGVEDWLRAIWKTGNVNEIHQEYRAGYTDPAPGENALLHNRAWITAHRDAIVAQFTSEAS